MTDKTEFVLVGDGESDSPLSPADRRMAIEMGQFAAREAVATMTRILKTLPADQQFPASAVANGSIVAHLNRVAAEVDKIAPGYRAAAKSVAEANDKHLGAAFATFATAARRKFGFPD